MPELGLALKLQGVAQKQSLSKLRWLLNADVGPAVGYAYVWLDGSAWTDANVWKD